jgi:D-glycerate 3-kinase
VTDDAGADVRAVAAAGPAFAQLARTGPIDWAAWRAAADQLGRDLDQGPDLQRRIHHLYLPVLFFAVARARASATRPLMVGMQAPQGAGKTTLVTHLLALLPMFGLRGAAVSIDDFYLTRAEQIQLAASHAGNPYLEHRGYPGTHDVGLGERTLSALQGLGGADPRFQAIRVPVYDKSAHGGRGDRAPEAAWREVRGPLDLVFVEGWMLGFTPVEDRAIDDPHLIEPNRALAAYARWHRHLDAFVVLRATDPAFVLRWRVEAEAAMVARGRPGLDRAAIEDYVRRFLPAYARYSSARSAVPAGSRLEIWLDQDRRPTTVL